MVAKIANVTKDGQKANAYLSNSTSINSYAAYTSETEILYIHQPIYYTKIYNTGLGLPIVIQMMEKYSEGMSITFHDVGGNQYQSIATLV